jgi:hypothetical protein
MDCPLHVSFPAKSPLEFTSGPFQIESIGANYFAIRRRTDQAPAKPKKATAA